MNYLLDTNHLSPLVTIGHPLRQQKLGSDAPDSGLNLTGLEDLSGLVMTTKNYALSVYPLNPLY